MDLNLPPSLVKAADIFKFEVASFKDNSLSLGEIVLALSILLIGLFAARKFSVIIGDRVLKRLPMDKGGAAAIRSLTYYSFLLLLVMFALNVANIPLTLFTFLGGAVAIGIGFGTQNLINNFISGLIILVERPIRVGDMVEIEGIGGTVSKVGPRCTHILTYGQGELLVPNSYFLEKKLINWTLTDTQMRRELNVTVCHNVNPRDVQKIIIEVLKQHEYVLAYPPASVVLSDFADGKLQFKAYYSIDRPLDRLIIESDLRLAIEEEFRKSKVDFVCPPNAVQVSLQKMVDGLLKK